MFSLNGDVALMIVLMAVCFRFIVFGNKSSSKYLIGATEHYLTVWDLLTCSGKLCVCVCVCVCVCTRMCTCVYMCVFV